MDAEHRLRHLCSLLATFASVLLLAAVANGADFRTQNFIIQAPTPALAKAVGEAAEKYRHDLAVYWTGNPLRSWPTPCPVRVIAGPHLAAQGVTTYNPAPVRDFQMEVVGTPQRILDSVLPHEVTHTVLATHFGRPLPRWADEGICTTVEHDSERNKHEAKLREFLRSRRGIPMNQLFLLTEYPSDVLPMYAQGYSVCQFLIAQKGPKTFIQFLQDYIGHPSWTANVRKHYEYESLAELQNYWLQWVSAGSGPVARFAKVQSADTAAGTELANNALSNRDPSKPDLANRDLPHASATEVIQTPDSAVATASFESPNPSPLASQGAASSPLAAVAPAAELASLSPPPPPASSRTDSESPGVGWYQRQRFNGGSNTVENELARAPIRPMIPPSVRQSGRYQTAQPQAEGGVSRAGEPIEGMTGNLGSADGRFR